MVMKKKGLFCTDNMNSVRNKVSLQIQVIKSCLCSGGGILLSTRTRSMAHPRTSPGRVYTKGVL